MKSYRKIFWCKIKKKRQNATEFYSCWLIEESKADYNFIHEKEEHRCLLMLTCESILIVLAPAAADQT